MLVSYNLTKNTRSPELKEERNKSEKYHICLESREGYEMESVGLSNPPIPLPRSSIRIPVPSNSPSPAIPGRIIACFLPLYWMYSKKPNGWKFCSTKELFHIGKVKSYWERRRNLLVCVCVYVCAREVFGVELWVFSDSQRMENPFI